MRLALVLAAGRGTRVGGAKALLMIDGEPLARAHARLRSVDCERVVIVVRRDVERALAREDENESRASFCVSEEEDALGPAGSIRAAVKAGALEGAAKVLVTPVDVVPAPSSAVQALFDALEEHDAAKFEHGHPIAIRAKILGDSYASETRPLRDVLTSLGARTRTLPMPRAPLPRTLDRVEDVVSLTGAQPRFWMRGRA